MIRKQIPWAALLLLPSQCKPRNTPLRLAALHPGPAPCLVVHVGEGRQKGDEHPLHHLLLRQVPAPPAQLHIQVACKGERRAKSSKVGGRVSCLQPHSSRSRQQ